MKTTVQNKEKNPNRTPQDSQYSSGVMVQFHDNRTDVAIQTKLGTLADGSNQIQKLQQVQLMSTALLGDNIHHEDGVVQRMETEEFYNILAQKEIDIDHFMTWFKNEFEIMQNMGALDATVIGWNEEGMEIYKQAYSSIHGYIGDCNQSAIDFHINDYYNNKGYASDEENLQFLGMDTKLSVKQTTNKIKTGFKYTAQEGFVNLNDKARDLSNQQVLKLFPANPSESNDFELRKALMTVALDQNGYNPGNVKEQIHGAGKNNRGAFRATTSLGKVFIKVVLENGLGQFSRMLNDQQNYPTKETDPSMPDFGLVRACFDYKGLGFGILGEAPGSTIEDLHAKWNADNLDDDTMRAVYSAAGSSLGAMHFSGLENVENRSWNNVKGKKMPLHGDANLSNIFVDTDDMNVTLIDNDAMSTDSQVANFDWDINSFLLFFAKENISNAAAEAIANRENQVANTTEQNKLRKALKMYEDFGRAYVAKAPNESIKNQVAQELNKHLKRFLDSYLQKSQEDEEIIRESIPEFFFDFTSL